MNDSLARAITHFNAEEYRTALLAFEELWHAERSDFYHKTGYNTPGNKWVIEVPLFIPGQGYVWKNIVHVSEITQGVN